MAAAHSARVRPSTWWSVKTARCGAESDLKARWTSASRPLLGWQAVARSVGRPTGSACGGPRAGDGWRGGRISVSATRRACPGRGASSWPARQSPEFLDDVLGLPAVAEDGQGQAEETVRLGEHLTLEGGHPLRALRGDGGHDLSMEPHDAIEGNEPPLLTAGCQVTWLREDRWCTWVPVGNRPGPRDVSEVRGVAGRARCLRQQHRQGEQQDGRAPGRQRRRVRGPAALRRLGERQHPWVSVHRRWLWAVAALAVLALGGGTAGAVIATRSSRGGSSEGTWFKPGTPQLEVSVARGCPGSVSPAMTWSIPSRDLRWSPRTPPTASYAGMAPALASARTAAVGLCL